MVSIAKMQLWYCREEVSHRQYKNECAWLFPTKFYKNSQSVGEPISPGLDNCCLNYSFFLFLFVCFVVFKMGK